MKTQKQHYNISRRLNTIKNMKLNNLGTQISAYRNAHKMSQSEFAKKMDVSQVTVGYWEYGRHFPKGKIYDKLLLQLEPKSANIENSGISLFKRICENFSLDEIPILGKVIERFR